MSYIYGLLKGAISALLHLMYSLTGNFGVAIILATIVIKIILNFGMSHRFVVFMRIFPAVPGRSDKQVR